MSEEERARQFGIVTRDLQVGCKEFAASVNFIFSSDTDAKECLDNHVQYWFLKLRDNVESISRSEYLGPPFKSVEKRIMDTTSYWESRFDGRVDFAEFDEVDWYAWAVWNVRQKVIATMEIHPQIATRGCEQYYNVWKILQKYHYDAYYGPEYDDVQFEANLPSAYD